MKLPKELQNGILIFIAVGIYFILMEMLGLSNLFYLRVLNVVILLYGTHRTLQYNYDHNKRGIFPNLISALYTSITGVVLSIIGLVAYSYAKGGDEYISSLSKTFLFGGETTVMNYTISLFFEGIASAVIVSFILILFWDKRYKTDKHPK